MRILMREPEPRHLTVTEGLAAAFGVLGHEFRVWGRGQPAFDAFDEYKPHVYVRTGPGPGRAELRALADYPHARVVDRSAGIRPAFDSLRYEPGRFDPALACDFCFVGSYRPEKRALIDSHLVPLFEAGFKGKLFGPVPMPYPEYLGPVAHETLPDLYASATVVLDITASRDSERYYQARRLGRTWWSSAFGHRPDDAVSDVRHAVESGGLWNDRPESVRYIDSGHTYFHRVADIFREAGVPREADRTLEFVNGLTE